MVDPTVPGLRHDARRPRSIDATSDSGVRGSQPTLSRSCFRMKRETHSRRAFDIAKPVRAGMRHLGAVRTMACRKPWP
jgi:hypothetical protein